mgnify:CR=1 FL=1
MPAMKSQLFFVAFAWLNGTIFQSQTHTKQYKWKGDSRIPTLSHSQARSFWEKSGDLPFFIIVCWDRFPLAYIHRVISLVIWKATARLRVVCNFGMEYESGQNARTRARVLESRACACISPAHLSPAKISDYWPTSWLPPYGSLNWWSTAPES